MSEANKEVIRRFVEELYNEGNLDVADEIIHPNTRNPRGGPTWGSGPEGVKQSVSDSRASASDFHRTILDMVADDEKVVLYSQIEGTHTGANRFMPYPATGIPISLTGVATFVIEDGKIVEEPWSHWNFSDIAVPVAKAHIRRWFEEGWTSRDPDSIDRYFAEDYVGHGMGIAEDRDSLKKMFTGLWDAFPDLTVTLQDQVMEGDRIVSRIVWTGEPSKEFMDASPADGKITKEAVVTFRLSGGMIVEGWTTAGPFTKS